MRCKGWRNMACSFPQKNLTRTKQLCVSRNPKPMVISLRWKNKKMEKKSIGKKWKTENLDRILFFLWDFAILLVERLVTKKKFCSVLLACLWIKSLNFISVAIFDKKRFFDKIGMSLLSGTILAKKAFFMFLLITYSLCKYYLWKVPALVGSTVEKNRF